MRSALGAPGEASRRTRVLMFAGALVAALVLADCGDSGQAREQPASTPTAASPTAQRSATDSIPTTPATSKPAARTSGPAGVPACGAEVPPLTETTLISTPAPDTCSFPVGGSPSPACPIQPTEVVDGTETRPPTPSDLLSGSPTAGFGRFGGERGSSMCFAVYPGDKVFLTNGDQGVLLPSSSDPLRVAGRTQLARSAAIWGAASSTVDHVELQDSARPNGIAVTLSPVGSGVRVFVAPVSAGSSTITAFGPDGTVMQVVKQG